MVRTILVRVVVSDRVSVSVKLSVNVKNVVSVKRLVAVRLCTSVRVVGCNKVDVMGSRYKVEVSVVRTMFVRVVVTERI